MENLKPEFAGAVTPGDVVVGGHHFGQSSGRAVAAKVLKASGVACIVADSFARTFLRNCFEIGLPLVECAGAGTWASDGDLVEVDAVSGAVRNTTTGVELAGRPTDPFLLKYAARRRADPARPPRGLPPRARWLSAAGEPDAT